jgi:[acyl-carrier-protein] S-malonyltransferase
MSYAVLFSGQGTQAPGMLPWLEGVPASQAVLAAMEATLGSNWRAALQDTEQRSSNAFAQPLITGTALAAWAALAPLLDAPPTAIAGYSVGELAACACAGVFTAQTAIALAEQRAAWMDAAVGSLETGLLSVSGLPQAQVLQMQPALDCAIEIGPQHAIYAGEASTLTLIEQVLLPLGAVCKRLDVRVASHSHWMRSAATGFAGTMNAVTLSRPHATLVLNATGAGTREPQTVRRALSAQIATTVQWAACMDTVAEHGVACAIEIGAGNTLTRMWRQRHPEVPVRSIDEFRDAMGASQWLRKQTPSR